VRVRRIFMSLVLFDDQLATIGKILRFRCFVISGSFTVR